MKRMVLIGLLVALAGCSLTEPFAQRKELPPRVETPPPPPRQPVTAESVNEQNAVEKARDLREEIKSEMRRPAAVQPTPGAPG